jgi:exonuclease SbcD
MKILHFSDLHLGMENYGHIDPSTGLSSRFLDWQKALDDMIAIANNEDVDVVIFSGDAFKNRDPSPTYQNAFARALKAFSEPNRQVILLVGNHDLPNIESKAHTLEIYRSLDLPRVRVSKKIEQFTISTKSGPLGIVTWPWITRNFLLKNESYKGKSLEEIDTILLEKASQLFQEKIMELTPGIAHVAIVHATVMGATFGSERNVMIGKDLVVPLSLLANNQLHYVACGHLHRHQVLHTEPYVVYAGSPQRIDFGEEKEEKGCVLVTINEPDFKTTVKFIPLAVRDFYTWHINTQLNPPEQDVEGKVVRVIVSGDEEFVSSIGMQNIKDYLQNSYYFAGIERRVDERKELKKTAKNRVNKQESIYEQVKKYLAVKQIDQVSQDLVITEAKKIFSSTESE